MRRSDGTAFALALLSVCTLAVAQEAGEKKDDPGGLIAVALTLVLVPLLQFVFSIFVPRFTRRAARAYEAAFMPSAGWGAAVVVLFVILASIFTNAGGAGDKVGAGLAITAALLAIAGGVGISMLLGDWALRRWGLGPMGPLSVLVGATVWVCGALAPIVGWLLGLLSLFASLGIAVQLVLHPAAFDEPVAEQAAEEPDEPLEEKLSVIIPVYNELSTVHEVIERVKAVPMAKEIIVVDDGSTDGTKEALVQEDDDHVTVYTSPTNFGKGAAIRIGLTLVTGDVVIVQDADLELDPEEYPRLVGPVRARQADVVYGSRFFGPTPGISARTRIANRLLAMWCNVLYRSHLTDVSTAYKVFRTPVLKAIPLRSIGFEFCAEVTARLLRGGRSILEVPIGYHPRGAAQGKKLNYLRDGFKAAWWLLWLRFASLPGRPRGAAP